MRAAAEWLEQRRDGAPPDLFNRVRLWLDRVDCDEDREDGTVPEILARAGRVALDHVTDSEGNRPVALDLLAADALVTFAMEACAELSPGSLARFARTTRRPAEPG